MVLAELYEKDTEEFLGIVMCNNKEQLDNLLSKTSFSVEVEIDAVNFDVRVMLQ